MLRIRGFCEKACGYDGACGAYATMPFRKVRRVVLQVGQEPIVA